MIVTDGSLAHEMVHMIGFLGDFSYSLDDGRCEYVNARVGVSYLNPEWNYIDCIEQ